MIHPDVNDAQGWVYTDAKYWPSEKTAMYYMGLGGGSLTGGRFLAPGAAANKGTYTNQLAHKNYDSVEAVFEALSTNGLINVVRNVDGSIEYVDLYTVDYFYTNNYDTKDYSVIKRITAKDSRHAEDSIIDAVVAYYAEGYEPNDASKWKNWSTYYSVDFYSVQTATNKTSYAPLYLTDEDGKVYKYADGSSVVVDDGDIILVSRNRKGEYTFEGLTSVSYKSTPASKTGEGNLAFNQLKNNEEYVIIDYTTATSSELATNVPFGKKHIQYMEPETGRVAISADYAIAVAGDRVVDAISLSTYTDDELYGITCAGVKATVTAKDVKKLNTTTGKLEAVDELTYSAWNSGLYYYGDYNLGNTLTTPLVDREYDFVSGGQGYYYQSNGTYFHLTNDVNNVVYDTTNLDVTYSIRLRGENIKTGIYNEAVGTGDLNDDYNAVTMLGKDNSVVVVDITDVDGIKITDYKVTDWGYDDNETDTTDPDKSIKDWQDDVIDGYPTRIQSFTSTAPACYENLQIGLVRIEDFSIEYRDRAVLEADITSLASAYLYGAQSPRVPSEETFEVERGVHSAGIYYLETPENDSEYYVLYTGKTSGLTLDYSVNTRTETVSAEAADGTDLSAKAVELDGVWYPAFETEEELIDFVVAIAGVEALEGDSKDVTSDFYEWYVAAVADTHNKLNGPSVYGQVMPTDSISDVAHAVACEYKVSSTGDASKVTVTNNLADIDTTVAGVHDLVYTASYDGEEVGTTTVKVVVAPKYVRTWENGRVKTLTSYYVSNTSAKYAEYNYDWTAGTVTVTYFNLDGSVDSNATLPL